MKAWTIEAPGVGKLGVAIAGLVLPLGLNLEEALAQLRTQGGLAMQLVDWRAVASPLHVLQASALAYKAFKEDRMVSRSLSMELLLYIAGERQIKEAIAKVGAREGRVVAICLADGEKEAVRRLAEAVRRLRATEDDALIELSPVKAEEVARRFNISEEELEASRAEGEGYLEALAKCVANRVAELDVEKEA
ncbi:MAG: hypothetical protein DRJ69_06920 [Thermoprotei archaeon]|nr:MAG: hypothetical protein DRJ69_06920 [Thermoprotei archaeon]